ATPPARKLPPPKAREIPDRARHSGRASGALHYPRSYRLQVRFKGLDRDLQRSLRIVAPQFAAIEHDGVEPLRVLALADRDGVGKNVTAAQRLDHTDLVAGIARQSCMRFRMDIFGAHAVARLEPRRLRRRPREQAARHDSRDFRSA